MINPKKAYTWFSKRFVLKKSTNGWHNFDCPFCPNGANKKKGAVIFQWGKVKCFVCGYAESLLQFVSEIEDISLKLANEKLMSEKESPLGAEMFQGIVSAKVSNVVLPKGYTPLLSGTGVLGNRARNYLEGRNFDLTELDSAGFGYCREEDPVKEENYFGYIIIPFKTRTGLLRYFIGRDYIGNFLRYKNPAREVYGVGKADMLFNEQALETSSVNFITEGWADAITMGFKYGLSSQGWSFSRDQKMYLHSSKAKRFGFLPDVGYYKKAVKLASEFMEQREVRVVNFEAYGYTEESGKDVNEIGREEVLRMFKDTPPLTETIVMETLMAEV